MFRKLFFATLALTLVALLAPGDAVLALKVWVASWLPISQTLVDQAESSLPLDKLFHCTLFAFLAAFAALAWAPPVLRWRWLTGLLLLALLTEWLQQFIPQRGPDVADLAANLVGITLGSCLVLRRGAVGGGSIIRVGN